jgi:hypothetical protein
MVSNKGFNCATPALPWPDNVAPCKGGNTCSTRDMVSSSVMALVCARLLLLKNKRSKILLTPKKLNPKKEREMNSLCIPFFAFFPKLDWAVERKLEERERERERDWQKRERLAKRERKDLCIYSDPCI